MSADRRRAKTTPSVACDHKAHSNGAARSFLVGSHSVAGFAHLALVNEGEADTLALGQGNKGVLAGTHAEDVVQAGGEGVAPGVLDVGDLVGTGVVFDVLEDSNTADVVSADDEDGGAVLELDEAIDFSGLKVELDGVVDLDVGVGETDGSAVVGHNVGDLVLADLLLGNFAELEGGLLDVNGVGLEATLDVVEHAESFASLGNGHDVHEAKGVAVVAAGLVVNLDVGVLVLADLDALLVREGVLQTVLEQDAQGNALAQLVRAGRGAGRVDSLQFVQAPGRGGELALQMLFGSTSLIVLGVSPYHFVSR